VPTRRLITGTATSPTRSTTGKWLVPRRRPRRGLIVTILRPQPVRYGHGPRCPTVNDPSCRRARRQLYVRVAGEIDGPFWPRAFFFVPYKCSLNTGTQSQSVERFSAACSPAPPYQRTAALATITSAIRCDRGRTTYVASFIRAAAKYSADSNYFGCCAYERRADCPIEPASGGNGVYAMEAEAFVSDHAQCDQLTASTHPSSSPTLG